MGACFSSALEASRRQFLPLTEEADETPLDAKAIFPVVTTPRGPNPSPCNPHLKMLLTTNGMMRTSAPELLRSYEALRKKTRGNGVLVLIDAKLKTLSWAEHGAMSPPQHNNDPLVGYKRVPDVPGGKPQYAPNGELMPKSQAELSQMGLGYHSAEYGFHKNGHYSFADLNVLASGKRGEKVPVYISYLVWHNKTDYSKPAALRDEPEHHILVARGYFKNGKLTLMRSDGSGAMTDADYEVPSNYSQEGNNCFKPVSGAEFKQVVDSVHTVYSCGGVTWLSVNNLQPYFVDDGEVTDYVNPYGKSVLDATKRGEVVYIGQSAGTVCMSHDIGALTTDLTDFELEGAEKELNTLHLSFELGHKLMRPGLGTYVGIPYCMIFRPHLTFMPDTLAYQGRTLTLNAVKEELTDGKGVDAHYNVYCVTLADYDYKAGKGDALEISGGRVKYHVGYSADKDPLTPEAKKILKAAGHPLPADGMVPRQPEGNDPQGRSFYWEPADGEIYAAGELAKPRPWRVYASATGPSKHFSPCYPN